MKEQLPNKIHIIVGDFSSWDSHYTRNICAFYSREDAEKYIEKANRILKNFSKYVQDAFDRTKLEFEEDTSHEAMVMLLKEYEKTEKYQYALSVWGAHSDFQEFNHCYIEEVEIK